MPIPASQIVTVNPRLLTPGGNDLEFNGLLLSASELIPSSQLALPFPDADSVGEYFGLESSEYQAATIYFQGYNNSFTKPRAFYVGRRVAEDAAPFVRGGAFNALPSVTLAALKEVRDGGMSLTLGSHADALGSLDFSGASALSDIAQILQTAIRAVSAGGEAWTAATVTYSSLFDAFTITGGAAGAEEGVDYAAAPASGTDVSALLLLTKAAGAVLSPGMDAMTPAENMEAILDLTENFVCFTTVTQPTQADALAFAQWASGKGVNYLYIYWDNDPALLQAGSTSTIAAALRQANVGAACGVWDNLACAALIMGTAASIDWNRRNGTITFAFKAQDGVPANVTRGTDAVSLEAQGMNFMGDYATRNDQFIFLYPGQMFGSWKWIDTYLNAVWLNNALQVACMNGFRQTPRVPYNQEGYTLLKSWCLDPINRALYSGVIDTGVALSESQKSQLVREAGRDISSELSNDGYVLQIGGDPDDTSDDSGEAAARQSRESPEASLWYTYGGSVHKLDLASTVLA